MKRKSVGRWAWNAYSPMTGRGNPREDVLDVLDASERVTGHMSFGRMAIRKGVEASTPWGPARIEWPRMKITIFLNEKNLVLLDMAWLGKKTDFVFGDGVVMQFQTVKGSRTDVNYADEKGFVSFTQEKGVLPEGHSEIGADLTREEVKRMPKSERPKSLVTRDYVQYRIAAGGILPEALDNVVASLAIFAGFMQLMEEST